MGKGKKAKGKKRGGKKANNDAGRTSTFQIITPEQHNKAVAAAANRTEDPLKSWTRPKNEECPICMIPLPVDLCDNNHGQDTNYCVTCGKIVCMGCMFSIAQVHRRDGGDRKKTIEKARTCPFCRSNTEHNDDKSLLEKEMKRANAGNARSMRRVGQYYFDGVKGVQQDRAEGLKWYHRAVEAGDGKAAYDLGKCYDEGDGVDKDIDKALEYSQKSAELRYIPAFNLSGFLLMLKGEIAEAMLNYRKAVMCGMDDGWFFDLLRDCFKGGFITKEEYAYTLRENQVACNEMKTKERDAWKKRLSEWIGD